MNGDIITNFNLKDMIDFHNNGAEIGTIAVAKMRSPFGIVEINQENKINLFREKPILDHWIHAGVDIFKSDILDDFPDKGQMEETIFVELAEQRELRAFQIEPKYYWRSIDNPKDLQETEREWKGLENI
ncbi:MAG: nucleotidyltransferase, partial [Candidatus Heimdallarchaeota archaeon]|nr:nucleotidyltransferase [Candidatus Heimdallarchaeota archaeon]